MPLSPVFAATMVSSWLKPSRLPWPVRRKEVNSVAEGKEGSRRRRHTEGKKKCGCVSHHADSDCRESWASETACELGRRARTAVAVSVHVRVPVILVRGAPASRQSARHLRPLRQQVYYIRDARHLQLFCRTRVEAGGDHASSSANHARPWSNEALALSASRLRARARLCRVCLGETYFADHRTRTGCP